MSPRSPRLPLRRIARAGGRPDEPRRTAAKRLHDAEVVAEPCRCPCEAHGTPWFAQSTACLGDCHVPALEDAPYLGTMQEMAEQWRADRETARLLEARIGELLGPAEQGGDRRSLEFKSVAPDLKRTERWRDKG